MGESKGTHPQTIIDNLLRQVAVSPDRTASSSVTGASRLLGHHHTTELTPATARAFAAEVTAATNSLLEPPSTSQLDQIVQAIRLQWSRGGGEAHIRLEPQHFGELTVSLRVDQGQVVARLQADTPIVREWLQANQQVLRQSLAEQNLTLNRLEVSEPSQSRQGAARDGQHEQGEAKERSARRPRTPDAGETFEVVA
jgi:flagellar hook-length control protein FliK